MKIFGIVYEFLLRPSWSFLADSFFPTSLVAYLLRKKLRSSEAFLFLRHNSAKILNAHFPIQIHFSAICVGSLALFFDLRRTIEYQASYRNVISMTLTTFWIESRRFTCFNFQYNLKLWVDPKQTVDRVETNWFPDRRKSQGPINHPLFLSQGERREKEMKRERRLTHPLPLASLAPVRNRQ